MIDSHRATRTDEDGVVLVWTALMVFGLFGLAALVIDLGQVRAAQQRLMAGAETAALEAARFRDELGDGGRRFAAATALDHLFDDDFDPSDDAIGVGAGAVVALRPREPSGNFSPRIELGATPADRVYKPSLQTNSDNAQHGDIVAGTATDPAGPSIETRFFARNDFTPVPEGSGAPALQAAPDVLVRLRRTADRKPLDREPGISSAGPPLPLLFGFVGVQPGAPGAYNPRTDGLSIRATAIAGGRRALVVSADRDGTRTVAPFALEGTVATGWNGIAPGDVVTYQIDGSTLRAGAGGPIRGWLTAIPAQGVGQPVTTTTTAPSLGTFEAVVPVATGTAGGDVVIGFTLATVQVLADSIQLTKRAGGILSTGATAHGTAALDARLALQADPALAAAHAGVAHAVLAPVLLR